MFTADFENGLLNGAGEFECRDVHGFGSYKNGMRHGKWVFDTPVMMEAEYQFDVLQEKLIVV